MKCCVVDECTFIYDDVENGTIKYLIDLTEREKKKLIYIFNRH